VQKGGYKVNNKFKQPDHCNGDNIHLHSIRGYTTTRHDNGLVAVMDAVSGQVTTQWKPMCEITQEDVLGNSQQAHMRGLARTILQPMSTTAGIDQWMGREAQLISLLQLGRVGNPGFSRLAMSFGAKSLLVSHPEGPGVVAGWRQHADLDRGISSRANTSSGVTRVLLSIDTTHMKERHLMGKGVKFAAVSGGDDDQQVADYLRELGYDEKDSTETARRIKETQSPAGERAALKTQLMESVSVPELKPLSSKEESLRCTKHNLMVKLGLEDRGQSNAELITEVGALPGTQKIIAQMLIAVLVKMQ